MSPRQQCRSTGPRVASYVKMCDSLPRLPIRGRLAITPFVRCRADARGEGVTDLKVVGHSHRKLLVANRSEIAIRCFRAATELGMRTVAIYSHEDRFSLHRFKADEAFLIGPPQGGEPVRSYLNINAIVAVAVAQGVDCIHPGYGFLAENADFARACEAAGIQFIGPTPDHLDAFGDKTAAKKLAVAAGVPTIPSFS